LARTIRLPCAARTGVLDVCLVRARTRDADGRARVRRLLLRVVRCPSRGDPGPGRAADGADRTGSQGPSGTPAGRVRGRSGSDRLGPFPLPATTDPGTTCVRPVDPRGPPPR